MSMVPMGGEGDFDIFGQVVIQGPDPTQMARAFDQYQNQQDNANRESYNRQRQWHDRNEGAWRDYFRNVRNMTDREYDLFTRLFKEFASRERSVEKERLHDRQSANRQREQEQRRSDNEFIKILDDRLKKERISENRRLSERIRELNEEVVKERAAQQRITNELQSQLRMRENTESASDKKSVARTKATWSIIRGTIETSQRFISSSVQAHYQRKYERQRAAEDREVRSLRGNEEQKQAILRSSFAEQQAITTRALARQQGAVAAFSRTASTGILGSFFRARNLLLGAGAFFSARAIFGPVADYQQTQIAFESLLGSAQRAERFLDRIRRFAEITPFNTPQLLEASQRLLGVGFAAREIIPDLTAIGNVAATLGQGEEQINGVVRALGQIRGKGKTSAEELNQISEQLPGFSAVEAIAHSLGITVAETFDRMQQGEVSAEEGIEGILQGMREFHGAAGAMDKQSKTIHGRLSTLHDVMINLVIDALSPFTDEVANLLKVFTDLLTSLFRGRGIWAIVRSGLMGIAIGMGAIIAVKSAVTVVQLLGTALGVLAANPLIAGLAVLAATITILVRHVPAVREFFKALVDGLTSFARGVQAHGVLARFLDNLIHFDWEKVGHNIQRMFRMLVRNLGPILEPAVGAVQNWISNAVDAAVAWLNSDGVVRFRQGVISAFETVRSQVGDFFSALFGGGAGASGGAQAGNRINEFITTSLVPALQRLGNAILEFFHGINWGQVGIAILNGLRAAAEFISGPVLERILSRPVLTALLAVVAAVAAAAGSILLGLLQGLSRSLPKAITNLRGIFRDLFRQAVASLGDTRAGQIVAAIGRWLDKTFATAIAGIDVIGAVVDAISGRGDWGDVAEALGGLFRAAFEQALQIADIFGLLSGWVSDLGSSIEGPLGGLVRILSAPAEFVLGMWNEAFTLARRVIQGFIDVIAGIFTGDFGRVVEGFKEILGSIPQFIMGVFGRVRSLVVDVMAGFGQFLWGVLQAGLNFFLDQITNWGANLINFWASIPGRILDALSGLGHLGVHILRMIGRGLAQAAGAAGGFAADLVNGFIDFVNAQIIDRINDLLEFEVNPPGPGSIHFNPPDIPHIPRLAGGGIVTQPTLAIIGEAGPEAIIPLGGQPGFGIGIESLAPLGDELVRVTEPGMRQWADMISAVLLDIYNRFFVWTRQMAALAMVGGNGIVTGLSQTLQKGVDEVGRIVGNYTRALANALNPILNAIGEKQITVRAFAQGAYAPRVAEGIDGPQVHVFNEAGGYGEAYIPFDPSYRHRARDIAGRSVGRLGGRVQWFREGGITDTVGAGEGVPNVSGDIIGLVQEFANRLSSWAGSRSSNFFVTSGFRTYTEQVAAWHRYLAGQGARAAFPGTSMHEFGLAVDGPHWAGFNPAAFGIHYPVSGEPWHAEPIEGKGLLHGDTQFFPGIVPLPQPPGNVGQRGWLSMVARAVMDFMYRKSLGWAGQASMSPNIPSLGSYGASSEVMAGIRRAMAIVGVPANWIGPLMTLISRESGFNPRAYNGILGASGLMQTIPSTFAAYALPGYGNIFGIIDNVIAGLRYILSRYGSIFNVGQATAASPTRGYRFGGYVGADGPAMVHAGEFVIPADLVRTLGGPALTVADLRAGISDGMLGGKETPLIGNQTVNIQSNASDPEAVGVVVNSRLRSAVAKVRR